MENMTVENFMIAGQAMGKVVTFFWPVFVGVFITWAYAEYTYNREVNK